MFVLFPQIRNQHNKLIQTKQNVDDKRRDGLHPGDGADHQSVGERHGCDSLLPPQETREEDVDDQERDAADCVGALSQHKVV